MYKIDRMRKQYKSFTAADSYIIGFVSPIDNKTVYGIKWKEIPRKYTTIQKECSKAGGDYGLYVNISSKKAQMQLIKKGFIVGNVEQLNSPQYNKGVMFEKLVYEYFGQTFRGKDNVPFYQAGDIEINGEQIQVKFLKARICYDKTLRRLAKENRA